MAASASLQFLAITARTLSFHHSSSASTIPSLLAPSSLKPIPKLIHLLSFINCGQPISRFIRNVTVSSDLDEEVEEDVEKETLDFSGSGSDEPSFSPDLKLFVGNLPFTVDSAELAGLFERAGNVEMVEVKFCFSAAV